MLEIDGSDGGGQLVRTALALSALSGEGFRLTDVRGGRDEPGLRPQHLAAVRLMADVCDAELSGATPGSRAFEFRPATLDPGAYGVDVGTAGSLTLLFDAVLPLAAGIGAPLSVAARGGTDVKWSPTAAYYRGVKLPLLRRHGVGAALDLDRTGFYPAGGGLATLHLAPSSPRPFSLVDRGELTGARIDSKAATDLVDREVAERQAAAAADALDEAGVPVVERSAAYVETDSPGSAVAVRLDFDRSIAGVDALGERGVSSEAVGAEAVEAAVEVAEGAVPVDRHLADQLAVFLAIAGGRVRVPAVTDHVETSRRLLAEFDRPISVDRAGEHPTLVGPDPE